MPIVHPYAGEFNAFDGRIEMKGVWTLPRDCPYCEGKLIGWGGYWRGVCVDGKSSKQRMRMRRMRCKRCKRTMAVLPQFLAPYQRVVTAFREQVVKWWALGKACGAWPRGRALASEPLGAG